VSETQEQKKPIKKLHRTKQTPFKVCDIYEPESKNFGGQSNFVCEGVESLSDSLFEGSFGAIGEMHWIKLLEMFSELFFCRFE
jgi:hypothetical protein